MQIYCMSETAKHFTAVLFYSVFVLVFYIKCATAEMKHFYFCFISTVCVPLDNRNEY